MSSDISLKARTRQVSQSERLLWRHAIRGAQPIDSRGTSPPSLTAETPARRSTPIPVAVTLQTAGPSSEPISLSRPGSRLPSYNGLDRRTAERLGRGQIAIDGRLDLHGMTQHQARDVLDAVIARAWDQGKRLLLVITGKGSADDRDQPLWGSRSPATTGVLRASVPRWLHEHPNRGRILAVSEAQPRHGGSGALYVLIRRRRE